MTEYNWKVRVTDAYGITADLDDGMVVTVPAVPDIARLVVWNAGTEVISVIDPDTYTIEKSITVAHTGTNIAGNMHDIRILPNGSKAYVLWRGGELYEIDLNTNAVSTVITGLADLMSFQIHGGYAYIAAGSADQLHKVNLATGAVTSVGVGTGSFPMRTAISLDGMYIYVSHLNSPHRIIKLDTSTLSVVATSDTTLQAKDMAVSPDGTMLYATNTGATTDAIRVFNTTTMVQVGTISLSPGAPTGIAVDSTYLYVCHNLSTFNQVSKYNRSTLAYIGSVTVHKAWVGALALNSTGSTLFVTNSNQTGTGSNDTVAVINTATMTVTTNITVRDFPAGISIAPPPSATASMFFQADLTKAKVYTGSAVGDSYLTTGFTATPTLLETDGTVYGLNTITIFDPFINTDLVDFYVSVEFPEFYLYVIDVFFTDNVGAIFAPGIPDANWIPNSNQFLENIFSPIADDPKVVDNTNAYMLDGTNNPGITESMGFGAWWAINSPSDIIGTSVKMKISVLINTTFDRTFLTRYYIDNVLVGIYSYYRRDYNTSAIPVLGNNIALRLNTADSTTPASLANVTFDALGVDDDLVVDEHYISFISAGNKVDIDFTIEADDKVVFIVCSGPDGDVDLYAGLIATLPPAYYNSEYQSWENGTREFLIIRDSSNTSAPDGDYRVFVDGYVSANDVTVKIVKVKG